MAGRADDGRTAQWKTAGLGTNLKRPTALQAVHAALCALRHELLRVVLWRGVSAECRLLRAVLHAVSAV